ncbi:hypothetical protein Tco_1202109 [Tanacetum coccineum]
MNEKTIADCNEPVNNSRVIAPRMYKLDLQPLPSKLRNNKEVHENYLKVIKEHSDTLCGIIEQASALEPSDITLDYACTKFTMDGIKCLMTRITSTKVVPPRESIQTPVITKGTSSSASIRKPKITKSISQSNEPSILGPKPSNNSKPNRNWGSNVSNSLSSSRVSKFLGTVKFGNDQVARIIRNAFQKHTCFVRNLQGADLLIGSRDTNLYTLSLDDMLKSFPICLLSKASKTKSLLWNQRLSHLNFGKSKKHTHKPNYEDSNQEKLYLLHMDLCCPMRIESMNEKKYILVIVDDYSWFT